MILEEIDIGKTEDSKKKAIFANFGKQAILYDEHERLNHVLLIKEDDNRSYEVKFGDGTGLRTLHYNDLQKLYILYSIGRKPLPKIDIEKDFRVPPKNFTRAPSDSCAYLY